MEKASDPELARSVPDGQSERKSQHDWDRLWFILGVLALYTAMHGGMLIADVYYIRLPPWLQEAERNSSEPTSPIALRSFCLTRANMAYYFVASHANSAWPDAAAVARPAFIDKDKTLRLLRRHFTLMAFFGYFQVGEGFWQFCKPLLYWILYAMEPNGQEYFWRAITSTIMCCVEYAAVAYFAWFLLGMWFHPNRWRVKESAE